MATLEEYGSYPAPLPTPPSPNGTQIHWAQSPIVFKDKFTKSQKKINFLNQIKLTDMEKANTFLISSGCDTAPIHLINRTFSSCKSASLNSFIMASKMTSSPCLRTVLYTADLKSAGMVDSPAQWAWKRVRASARVAGWPYLPKRPIIRPLRRASRCPKGNKQYYILHGVTEKKYY